MDFLARREYGFERPVAWGEVQTERLGWEQGIDLFARKWTETIEYVEQARREWGFLALTYDDLIEHTQRSLARLFRQ